MSISVNIYAEKYNNNMWGSWRRPGSRLLDRAVGACVAEGNQGWSFLSLRSIVSVDVHGNQVDRALKILKRRLIEDGIRETWVAQSVYSKPSEQHKLSQIQTKKRLANRIFKEKIRWIMRRKARGF